MLVAGIDVGSTTTKVVLLGPNYEVKGISIAPTGIFPEKAVFAVVDQCCRRTGFTQADIGYCVSTGYGRELVSFADEQITEITCHARGAHILYPGARGVIDIGGQDSKAISIDGAGRVLRFTMNDKCAAGTGRFLDVMARTMGINVEEMGRLSLGSQSEVLVSSVCTVFAESEVISLISRGIDPVDIMAGIHRSVARRVSALLSMAHVNLPIVMTGGVAKNAGVVRAFEEMLAIRLLIPEEPQVVGALGAAHAAMEKQARRPRPLLP